MANLSYQVTGLAYQGIGQLAYQGSVDVVPSGSGIAGGGSSDYVPMPEYKVPEWAKEQREERERAAEEARRRAEQAARVPVPHVREVSRTPEGVVSADTIAASESMARIGELGRRIEDIYGVPAAAYTEPNDDEEAVLVLLMNE